MIDAFDVRPSRQDTGCDDDLVERLRGEVVRGGANTEPELMLPPIVGTGSCGS